MSTNDDGRRWSVYKHTSPSGKVYVGIAQDVHHRWRGDGSGYKGSTRIWYAIQKYGWENFKHEILAHGLTLQGASELEKTLIRLYKATDANYGYNLRSGGYDGTNHPETRKKLSEALKGHSVSDKVRNLFKERNSIPVICIETGEIFESSADAANKMNLCVTSINKATLGKQATCGGYHFEKLHEHENGTAKKFVPSPHEYRRVRCVTTGEEYSNVCDASRKTGLSRRGISYACNGVHETCGKMRWEFIDPEDRKEVTDG